MMPWPIAILTLLYGVIAAASGAAIWKISQGLSDRSPVWPAAWLALAVGVMCGLPLLKSWARALAMAGSVVLMAVTLSVAGILVMGGRPLWALLATLGAGVHVVIIRYLRRPSVKGYFEKGA